MKRLLAHWKMAAGLLISILFLFLAFRKVDFRQMLHAFGSVNYWYLVPAVAVIFLSHWLRAWRWRYLLKPIREIGTAPLFSALLIGYMANTFLPAHLGELVRAYVIGKKKDVPSTAAFATIVVERIIDVFTLLVLMALTFIVFPSFPSWVKKSGYIMMAGIVLLFALLVLMKIHRARALQVVDRILRPFSGRLRTRVGRVLGSFLDGIVPLKKRSDYPVVTVLSLLIWLGYALAFQILFRAFGFVATYALPWSAAMVLLVITTISVVVPSSPGYVGTYHYLCQISLGLFAVPKGIALSFAFVMHAVNFIPVLVVGLILVFAGGMNLRSLGKSAESTLEPEAAAQAKPGR